MNRAWAAPGLFLLVLAMTGCNTSPAGRPTPSLMRLAYTFKAGQTYRYHYSATLNGTTTSGSGPASPVKADLSGDLTWKVVSVDASGNTTIDWTVSNLKTTVTDSMQPGSTTTTTTTTSTQHCQFLVTPTGESLLTGCPLGPVSPDAPTFGPDVGPPGTDQFLAVVPDNAVKPGDTWTKTFTAPSFPGDQSSVTWTTKNRFLRYDNLPSGTAAVIQTTWTIPVDETIPLPSGTAVSGTDRMQGTFSTNNTIWFDVKTHQIVKMTDLYDSDYTATFSGTTGLQSPPPQAQVPQGVGLFGPWHYVIKGSQRLDRVR